MTVFKAYRNILWRYRFVILGVTVLLLFFGAVNARSDNGASAFIRTKPEICIVNHDQGSAITGELTDYLGRTCTVKTPSGGAQGRSDALFYRDISCIVEIPEHYGDDLLAGRTPELRIRCIDSSYGSLAQMLLKRCVRAIKTSAADSHNEKVVLRRVRHSLRRTSTVQLTRREKLDADRLSRAAGYFSFASYAFLCGEIYVIGIILFIFNEEKIRRRTVISPVRVRRLYRRLLLCSSLFALVLWGLYTGMAVLLYHDVMSTFHGLLFALNALLFALCALTLAVLVGRVAGSRSAINGLMNIIALGSSFLCGAFVPPEMLPNKVVQAAHALPSYWFIRGNDLIAGLEGSEVPAELIHDMLFVAAFLLLFFVLSQILAAASERGRAQ
ncbi:MAG: ABC transporter permease [Anaerovoracaceae bacterium]|jgi:ABC-2 type transport system permease protein